MAEEQEETTKGTVSDSRADADSPEAAMPKLQGAEIPWRVMEIIVAMPDDVKPIGFIRAQVNTIVITENGFYGHYDGNIQKLPMTLVDNS